MDTVNNKRRRQHSRFSLNSYRTASTEAKLHSRLGFLVVEQQGLWQRYGWALLVTLASICFFCALFVFSARLVLSNANRLGRQCGAALERNSQDVPWGFSFGLVTCSDGLKTVRRRSFKQLMDLVSPNKKSYADKHGYTFIDASDMIDRGRPPNWSKIKAVQKHLGSFDWVLWNDADTLFTNSSITLEGILRACVGNVPLQSMPDMIITEDVRGVNTGTFFIRDTAWSRKLLDSWWNQTSFVRPFGNTISGDNDALKYLLSVMAPEEKALHIHIPKMQCLFNSYLWTPAWKNVYRLLTLTRAVWRGTYSPGDFMLHFAGIDNKKIRIRSALKELE